MIHVVLPLAIAMALVFLPTLASKIGAFGRRDNHETRTWQGKLEGWRQRAYWAHVNGLETFPMFAAALLAARVGTPESPSLPIAAYAFCALRLAYIGAYVRDLARVRSLLWFASMGAIAWLLVIAASGAG